MALSPALPLVTVADPSQLPACLFSCDVCGGKSCQGPQASEDCPCYLDSSALNFGPCKPVQSAQLQHPDHESVKIDDTKVPPHKCYWALMYLFYTGLAVLFRLYQEVWSNAVVVAPWYGSLVSSTPSLQKIYSCACQHHSKRQEYLQDCPARPYQSRCLHSSRRAVGCAGTGCC